MVKLYYKMSFAREVGRHGIEALLKRGYSNAEIAKNYDVSISTFRTACRQLYGPDWKRILNTRRAAVLLAA